MFFTNDHTWLYLFLSDRIMQYISIQYIRFPSEFILYNIFAFKIDSDVKVKKCTQHVKIHVKCINWVVKVNEWS